MKPLSLSKSLKAIRAATRLLKPLMTLSPVKLPPAIPVLKPARKLTKAKRLPDAKSGSAGAVRRSASPALQEIEAFGSNPGSLRLLEYVPDGARRGIVVVLHGCGQTARDVNRVSGWSDLARKHGFAVLFPEQRNLNNPKTCFNWFRPSSVARDRGEAGSIAQMIGSVRQRHRLSSAPVYVIGLSAGGAMAAALLAAYPDVFSAGAIVAGMPVGIARDALTALKVMAEGQERSPEDWADLVRRAAPEGTRAWPRVSIWQGDADRVVHPANAEALVSQWRAIHGLAETDPDSFRHPLGTGQVWKDPDGAAKVEYGLLPGFGHAMPVMVSRRRKVDFMEPSRLSLAHVMVHAWGLDKG